MGLDEKGRWRTLDIVDRILDAEVDILMFRSCRELHGLGLQGQLSPAIGNLPNLTYL
jgi:hypothetical protein